jgi:hypothetical protein
MPDALVSTAFCLIPAAVGTLATYLYEEDVPLSWRAAAGACTALAALGLIGFVSAFFAGVRGAAVLVGALGVGLGGLLAVKRRVRGPLVADLRRLTGQIQHSVRSPTAAFIVHLSIVAAAAVLLGVVLDRVLFVRTDGLHTGIRNNFGDLPFHLAVIVRFVDGANVPPENPIFDGVPFTYPFLADFVTAMPVATGATLRHAMLVQNALLLFAFCVLLYHWSLLLTGSRAAALLSCALVIASGGLGWWMLVDDVREHGGLVTVLSQLSHDYTVVNRTGWRWGNVVTALLIPQRSLLLGFPLTLTALTLLYRDAIGNEQQQRRLARRAVAAGIFTGLLPLVHAHSLLVVLGVALCLAVLSGPIRTWMTFFITVAIVAAPQLVYSTHATAARAGAFIAWSIGWDHGAENPVLFWLKNTGLLIPLLIAAFAWKQTRERIPPRVRLFYLPFVGCFIVANTIRLAPWVWDNIKVLAYWLVASAPFVSMLLVTLWQRRRALRPAVALITVSLTLAGGLDLWRVVSHAGDARVFDNDALAFADAVKQRTPTGALVLHAPVQNHPVFLSGRRSLMGYPGHVWSHGLDGSQREEDIKQIYAGSDRARELLARYAIDFAVVGPLERRTMTVNQPFFAQFDRVASTGGYTLYRIGRSQ